MLNHLYKYLLLLISVITFTSCEDMISDVDIDLPSEKIVVTSFITPDLRYTTVRVWKSRPLYSSYQANGEKFPKISDATVTLSSDKGTVTLSYDSIQKHYKISKYKFPIEQGKTYYLKVVTKEGIILSSHCTVPNIEPPAIECLSIDSIATNQNLYIRSNIRFKDVSGHGHNYNITASRLSFSPSRNESQLDNVGFNNTAPYFSDENNEGNYYNLQTNDVKINRGEVTKLYFTISVTDDHYYHYHKTLLANNVENPFTEPTPLYTNISGGLGVFAAYVQKTHVVDIN